MTHLSRLLVLAIAVTACAGTTTGGTLDAQSREPTSGTTGSLPTGPSALSDPTNPALPDPLVDIAELRSAGPPPDGIPPIDDPQFRSIEEAELSLADTESVVVLEINDDARAYPVEILIWHEIVNDRVGGVPVAITYCPLCNSAVTYERTVRGEATTFGTSGRLFASALVMYDRSTESLWTHFDGRAIAGVLAGDQLKPISSPLLSWKDFKMAHPSGKVLSRDTGFTRSYGRNPYFGYDNPDTRPFFFVSDTDERAAVKQRVVGVAIDGSSTAFSLDAVSGGLARATHATVGGKALVVFWTSGQTSALEDADTSKGRDVGSAAVFDTTYEGSSLTFSTAGDKFIDAQTSSVWNISGQAVSGELEGGELNPIPHLDTFWFAWSTYSPGTSLFEA